MRLPLLLAAAALSLASTTVFAPAQAAPRADGLAASQTTDLSAAKRKNAVRSQRRYARPAAIGPIACMRGGCQHIPAGCHIEPERTFDGTPTRFDMAVCPAR